LIECSVWSKRGLVEVAVDFVRGLIWVHNHLDNPNWGPSALITVLIAPLAFLWFVGAGIYARSVALLKTAEVAFAWWFSFFSLLLLMGGSRGG